MEAESEPTLEDREKTQAVLKELYGFQGGIATARLERSKQVLSSVLWGVGVSAPGLLGLLANARMLRELSWLSKERFSLLFVIAEGLFLLSVIVAVFAQWKLVGHINSQLSQQESLHRAHMQVVRLVMEGEAHDSERSDEKLKPIEHHLMQAGDKLKLSTELVQVRYPRMQYGLLVLAYFVAAILILTIDFI